MEIAVPEGANVGDHLTFNTAAGQFSLVVPSGAAQGTTSYKMMVTMSVPANFPSNQPLAISSLRIMPCRRLAARLRQLPHAVLANLAARLIPESTAPHTSTRLPTLRRAAKNMPSDRLSLRLGQLSHDVLAELAAQLCSESPALQATADECMAAHNPLPHEMVERVLHSPDLVPHILGPLKAEDGAVAAVCSQWLAGWMATNEAPWRRRLKQVPLAIPEDIVASTPCAGLQIAATPDGRLYVRTKNVLHILDRSMRVLQTLGGDPDDNTYRLGWRSAVAADGASIFVCSPDPEGVGVLRFSHDFETRAAEYQLEGHQFCSPVLAPGGLLFCVMFNQIDDEGDSDEIIALDAQTLQLRHRFGLGLLYGAGQLAVGGDELYVCDTNNNRLQVFSLTGEHRRSVTGEWTSPVSLCFANYRLYLVEREYDHDDDVEEGEDRISQNSVQRQRILVLSLEGDILQVVTHPTDPTAMFNSICCFDGKLLASYGSVGKSGVLALQGL